MLPSQAHNHSPFPNLHPVPVPASPEINRPRSPKNRLGEQTTDGRTEKRCLRMNKQRTIQEFYSGRQTNKWTMANIGGLKAVGERPPGPGQYRPRQAEAVQKPRGRQYDIGTDAHGQRQRQRRLRRGELIRRHKVLARREGNHGVPRVLRPTKNA